MAEGRWYKRGSYRGPQQRGCPRDELWPGTLPQGMPLRGRPRLQRGRIGDGEEGRGASAAVAKLGRG